eukprot:TRINITY_DN2576_c1_g2_i1.p1 TRINITY_DN2576_c1_g2~~TRINITY_DN2576_c1_g2_i1.p1  ORF type:complete len:600 (-),score=82.09 TRINITY_DN2576_c1_g2_i1:1725-3389(-)
MLAIMGSSGAGKTTLLDVLAGRNKAGEVSGSFQINGLARPNNFHRISGYVMQDDAFLETLTVRETLSYALKLRMDPNEYEGSEDGIIDAIIEVLNLRKIADSRIGDPLKRGISGGERRRLCIGVEMVISPGILFMDEPTSGLDARNALRVMKAIKLLCKKGHTIICTIHQPRSNIFKMFDYLLLIHEGESIYFGKANNAVEYFKNLGIICPNHINPADFLVDIVDEDIDPKITGGAIRSKSAVQPSQLPETYQKSRLAIETIAEIDNKYSQSGSSNMMMNNKNTNEKYATSFIKQFAVLSSRSWRSSIRDVAVMWVRVVAAIAIALLVGGIFFRLSDDINSSGSRINTLLFLMCVFAMFPVPAISHFIKDRLIFTREKASGYYSTISYFLSTLSVEFPTLLGIVFGYGSICYWMVGLEPSTYHFTVFIGIIFFVINIGFSVSQVVSAVFKSVALAIAIYMVFLVYSLLLGGFIVHKDKLPEGVQWLMYTSYIWYGFQGLVVNEFEDKMYGPSVISNMGMGGGDALVNLGILAGAWGVLQIITYILLRYFNKEKR